MVNKREREYVQEHVTVVRGFTATGRDGGGGGHLALTCTVEVAVHCNVLI